MPYEAQDKFKKNTEISEGYGPAPNNEDLMGKHFKPTNFHTVKGRVYVRNFEKLSGSAYQRYVHVIESQIPGIQIDDHADSR